MKTNAEPFSFVEALKNYPRWFDFARRATRACGRCSSEYRIIREFSASRSEIVFIQIGANDGIGADPLREFIVGGSKWRGVFVEPMPRIFSRLQENYSYLRRNNLQFCNAAISSTPGSHVLWKLRDEYLAELPPFAKRLNSFDKEHLIRHFPALPDIESKLEAIMIPCMTYAQLLEQTRLPRVDMLNIDVEGHEGQILNSIDFAISKPGLILFEFVHMQGEARTQIFSRLRRHGYDLSMLDMDCAAMLTR